jgi:hypothetical protein
MKYFKVQFNQGLNIQAYQVLDDNLTTVIGYINLDGTDITLPEIYEVNIIDDVPKTEEDILPGTLWHDQACNIRVKISFQNNLMMLQSYPELGDYIKANNINSYLSDNYVYIYVNYLLDAHKALLQAFGATLIQR